MRPIITFLSDFGTHDGYVGSVKGMIKSLVPDSEIIDISHRIPPHDVSAAAWAILNYYNSYPPGTIHLAVVDPGVGSERFPLILQTQNYFFVGPDNGIFRFVARKERPLAYRIKALKSTSSTFHGRDIFAPAAAKLALGISLQEIAEQLTDWKGRIESLYSVSGNVVEARAIAIDRFGNIVCGFHKEDLKSLHKTKVISVQLKNFRVSGISGYYAEKNRGEALALWGSRDYLEIAVNSGNAAQILSFDMQKDKIMIRVE